MAKKKASDKKPIEQYDHKGKKRVNNPPIGLVTPETDKESGKKIYAYDPHIDPALHWAGKKEHTSFEVPTVSLHVHERIDPRTIVEAVRKRNGKDYAQMSLFRSPEENPPLRDAIDFYKHKHNWSNRLIAGDSLLVMNSLLEKEGMAGQVQMIYIDPPYGIKYGSNFQPFVNKRDVKDGKDEDLTAEPEMIKAFRDTWELGIHSYLTYLRDRLLLARELLAENGSFFLQINDENLHYVQEIVNEVFGPSNFCSIICFVKTSGFSPKLLSNIVDYLLWYCKDINQVKYRPIFLYKTVGEEGATQYSWVESYDGSELRLMTEEERQNISITLKKFRILTHGDLSAQGASDNTEPFEWNGQIFRVPQNSHWKTTVQGLQRLADKKRLMSLGNSLRYKRYIEDFPVFPVTNVWTDTGISGFANSGDIILIYESPLFLS